MSGPVKVEQCDRDAADLLIRKLQYPTEYLSEIKDGSYDENYFVQAFARHRLSLSEHPAMSNETVKVEQNCGCLSTFLFAVLIMWCVLGAIIGIWIGHETWPYVREFLL